MRPGILSSVSLIVLLAMPTLAHAGFEFVAPSASNAAPASASPVSDFVESIQASPEKAPGGLQGAAIQDEALDMAAPIKPVESARADIPLAPIAVPLTPVVKNSDALMIESAPVSSAKTPVSTNAMPAPIGLPTRFTDSGKMNEGGNIQGFGRGVPLAIALQQIVPPSYRYSFEPPINPSMRISWSGGKAWKAVIADIARSNDMNVDIASNVVSFSRHKPMDMIAASTMESGSANTVQGVPLRPVAGQPMANDIPVDLATDLPAPVAMPEPASAPMPIAAPQAAPVIADATPQAAPLPAPSDINDLIYDGPSSSAKSYGSQPSMAARAPAPVASASMPPVMPAPAMPAPVMGERQALASISDAPLEPVPAVNAPAPASAETAPKSAFFDNLMDQGTPANKAVKEKAILTADSAAPAAAKPMDILDPKPLLAPADPKPSAQSPRPVGTASIAPLPPIMGNNPTSIAKQIDNSPVAANDLPSPMEIASAPVISELPGIKPDLTASQEWSAMKNQTLRQTLTAWSEQIGASLVWSSEYDYPLQTDVRIQASYADAVRTLLDGFSKAEPRPIGRLFKNDKVGAQPVLIVETQRLTQ